MYPAIEKLHDPVILTHTIAALLAVAGGIAMLTMRKGTPAHRLLGRLWVLAMLVTAGSSLLMQAAILPVGRFGPVHLLSLVTIGSVIIAVRAIRRGAVQAHRRAMTQAFTGLAIAGVFALAPGRAMNAAGHELLAWLATAPSMLAQSATTGARLQAEPGGLLVQAQQAAHPDAQRAPAPRSAQADAGRRAAIDGGPSSR